MCMSDIWVNVKKNKKRTEIHQSTCCCCSQKKKISFNKIIAFKCNRFNVHYVLKHVSYILPYWLEGSSSILWKFNTVPIDDRIFQLKNASKGGPCCSTFFVVFILFEWNRKRDFFFGSYTLCMDMCNRKFIVMSLKCFFIVMESSIEELSHKKLSIVLEFDFKSPK